MVQLNDIEAIKKIDPQGTLASTELLAEQCEKAWNDVTALTIDRDMFRSVKHIVFCGMGASIYGALVARSLFSQELAYPSEIVSDYHLPAYVNDTTLVVLTSYSGTTEEVLSCAHEAKTKGAKMLIITKGGPLAEFAEKNHIPSYVFDAKLNPAGVPRLGNGYTILGLLGLLSKTGLITIGEQEIADAIIRLKEKFSEIQTRAEKDYAVFADKIPVIIAAEHMSGNAHILRNQFHETSKAFACYFLIPDLNHHLMEGLQFPKNAPLQFLLFDSPNYEEKIRTRLKLTADVIDKNNHSLHAILLNGQTAYDDFLEAMVYGSFLTLYLGLHYDQNPAVNPWVDYFKEQLK